MRIIMKSAVMLLAVLFVVASSICLSSHRSFAQGTTKDTIKDIDALVDPANKVLGVHDGIGGEESVGEESVDEESVDEESVDELKNANNPPAQAAIPVDATSKKIETDVGQPDSGPSSATVATSPETTEASEVEPQDDPRRGVYGGRFYGRKKVQFAANKSTLGPKQKCYKEIYGAADSHLSVGLDWFPKDWRINPGVMFKLASHSAYGKAMRSSDGLAEGKPCSSLVADENSHTTLQYIPMQVGLKVQGSPFRAKYLVFDIWLAGEYGWWQETRDPSVTMIRPLSAGRLDQASSSTGNTKIYTNSGSKLGSSVGFSAHLLLNPLDARGVHSMVNSMGIGYVYLTAFGESVTAISPGLSYARNNIGVGFTFETVK
jgi:hypothetical protein